MLNIRKILWCALFIWLCSIVVNAKPVHHYVFFGQDTQKIHDASFIETKVIEGAQKAASLGLMHEQSLLLSLKSTSKFGR